MVIFPSQTQLRPEAAHALFGGIDPADLTVDILKIPAWLGFLV
jgi:hypothetical protein